MANEKRLDLINKLDVVNKLIQLQNQYNFYKNEWDADVLYRRIVELEIEIGKTPTVDAVEVVHGRWKYYHKQNIAVCTNCSFERNLDANFGKAVSCPNCGAHMDAEEA